MLRTIAEARTVWVKELVTEKRQGPNGEFDAKSILFRVATDRNYTRTVTKDGQQVEERPTDFILCRANGITAQVIADNCTAVDPATGKQISRYLLLIGHIEVYTQDRTFKIENLPLDIQNVGTVNVSFDTTQKVDGHIFIVDEIKFLDPKPQPKVQAGNVTVSNVQATVAQPAVQTAPVAQTTVQPTAQTVPVTQPVTTQPQTAPVQQTVQPQTTVAQPATTMQATVAQPVAQNAVAGAMNPPVVPEGYTGESAPF